MLINTKIAFPAAIVIGAAVSQMNRSTSSSCPYRLSRWSQVKCHFAEWYLRARSRNELMNLSDWTLRDIGVSCPDAEFEAPKTVLDSMIERSKRERSN
jgi:uncharacterized protein YjiS (DUF1127 family)